MTSAGPLLCATQISAGYVGAVDIIRGLSIELMPGEMVGLVGPNGSGKTTLLHCLTGYHPLRRGAVLIGAENAAHLSRQQIARHIAFVPQQTETVFSYSVMQMVLMGRHAYLGFGAVDSPEDIALANEALDNLGIGQLAQRPYHQLSGGEKQLVLLARCFAQRAPIVILDEPLTGLDLHHQFEIMSALALARDTRNTGVLATFHDLAAASRWCNRLVLLHEGEILAEGPPAAVITPDNLATLYGVEVRVQPDADGPGVTVQVLRSIR